LAGQDEASKRLARERIARIQDRSKLWPDVAENAPILLERVFDLRRGRKRTDVRVVFRAPTAGRLGYKTVFRIEGLPKDVHARTAMLGDDAIDSLSNAMRLAMVRLVSSSAYQDGQLTWHGMFDLDMPIFEEVEPLIKRELQASVIAKQLVSGIGRNR
jgi:hypothetical protein